MSLLNISNVIGRVFGVITKEDPLLRGKSYFTQAAVKGGDKFVTSSSLVVGGILTISTLLKLFGKNVDFPLNDDNKGGRNNNRRNYDDGFVRDSARFRR